MTLPKPHVLITGTTSGIGRSLLDLYAKSGVTVTALNRRKVEELKVIYPHVRFHEIDVRDGKAIGDFIVQSAETNQMPNTFILNAGINRVDNDASFDLEQFRDVLETNFFGVINFVQPLTKMGATLPRICIVAVSSMADYAGNPYCLGYFISKKALNASFEVLSEMYKNTNLQFKWLVLGPVHTAIYCTSEKFPKIMIGIKNFFSVSQDATARAIAEFVESEKHRLIFPWRIFFLFQAMRFAQRLIPWFYRGCKTLDGLARNVTQREEGTYFHAKR